MITFFVPGKPIPQGSKKHVGRGIMVESAKDLGPWRERVALAAKERAPAPLTGALYLQVEFIMPRPASTPKKFTPPAIKRPDLDKLIRAVMDGMTHICYHDDAQVIHIGADKRLAELDETPGVRIILSGGTQQ